MRNPTNMRALQIDRDGQLAAPCGPQSERNPTPLPGEIRGDETTGYGEIYINGRWVRFGQDNLPLVERKNAAYTQTGSAYVPVDTSSGGFKITLDNLAVPRDHIIFFDPTHSWYKFPFTISSTHNIDGKSEDLRVNSEDGFLELFYVSSAIGYVILNGSPVTNESGFVGSVEITGSTTAQPRTEYVLTADTNCTLTLPNYAPDGAMVRFIDGVGAGLAKKLKLACSDAIIDGNLREYEIGNDYGSVTVLCRHIKGLPKWIIVSDNTYEYGYMDEERTASFQMSAQEDRTTPANTTGGAFTITLPADPRPGQKIYISDSRGTWHLNPLTVDFGVKSSYPYGSRVVLSERFGHIVAIFNAKTNRWDALSSNTYTDVHHWEDKTGTFTAAPYTGYRIQTSGSFTINLPDPANVTEGGIIRLINVSNTAQASTNLFLVKGPSGDVLEGDLLMGGSESWCFRIKKTGNTKKWYLAETNGSAIAVKTKTTSFEAYGGFSYRADFGGNAVITLDSDHTKQGERVVIYDYDGGWAGRQIRLVPQTGTLDGWGERTFSKGYVRLELERVTEGWVTVSETYQDYRNVSSTGNTPKLQNWLRGIHHYDRRTSNFTAVNGYLHNVRVGSAGVSVVLPSPSKAGDQICLVDEYGMSRRYPITVSSPLIGGAGRSYMRLAANGGMILFEGRYDEAGLRWFPVLTPDGDNKYTYPVDTGSPWPNSKVPINKAMTVSLPTNAVQGDEITIYEHQYRIFKNNVVNVRVQGTNEMMNQAGKTFRIPPEVAEVTFTFSEQYNTWTITSSSLRINTDNGKLDLVTNLTWIDTTTAHTAQANFGYSFTLQSMGAARRITLPASGIELNSVVAVTCREGTNTNGRWVGFSGGTIDGINAADYEYLRMPGEYVELVNRGNGVWITKNRTKTFSKINYSSSNNINIDFTEGENTVSRTINGTTNISVTTMPGTTQTFFFLLRQDGTGNRAINIPSSWKRSAGSEELNLLRNTYNLIQGVCIGSQVFYNVTTYI
ncbi:hypothetical protein [Vibrio phage vB_pir03]|nr:hypothetical protein [Vibrio phage vB_pir03]